MNRQGKNGLHILQRVGGIVLTLAMAALTLRLTIAGCKNPSFDLPASAIRIERLHALEKTQLQGTAALYGGWTIDDLLEITMLYKDTTKPCPIDIAKPAVLIKYRVIREDGKPVFVWQLQPNVNDAGCMLEFASFRTGDEEEGHAE